MARSTAAPAKLHPVTRYAVQVRDGIVVAGELVRLACARHLRDLERQRTPELPYWFDEDAADAAFDFFEFNLCHYEGDLAGEPFILNAWEMFVIGSIYGWKSVATGFRRFRRVYIETAKGSGKTPLCAGIGLKGLTDDDEPGAQVFAAATTSEQAQLLFKDAKAMAQHSGGLGSVVIHEHNISVPSTNSYFRPVSSEAGNLHGKRPHIGLIDEIHVHKDDEVVEALQAGTKRRRQALIVMITNSGQDRRSLAWRYHELSRRILEQAVIDEEWFAYVCQLDVCDEHRREGKDMPVDDCTTGCDDWRDESVWVKANPSLPDTPGLQYLRGQVREAANMPAKADNVKRLNMCIWTSGKVQWIRPEMWRSQAPKQPTIGRVGYGGHDLSAVNDLTASAYVFPDGQDAIDIEIRLFLPHLRVDALAAESRVPYREWVDRGYIILTPGRTVDYDFVEADDEAFRASHEIRSSGIDPWQSVQFRAHLENKGVQIVTIPQTNMRLHAVVEEAERLMQIGGFRHGGHPVLEWISANVVLNIDAKGMKRIDKQASSEKIDPMAAILNALSEAMVAKGEASTTMRATFA